MGLQSAVDQIKRIGVACRDPEVRWDHLMALQEEFRNRLHDELSHELFFHLKAASAKYYDDPGFGKEVTDAFPSATLDIEEAAKCFALGRWTASVFHLMRTMEHGLRQLASFLGIESDFKTWDPVITKMTAELEYKTSSFRGNLDFIRQTLERLTAVRVALRNEVMHSRSFYDEERAVDIYRSVRGFMCQLALQIKEPSECVVL